MDFIRWLEICTQKLKDKVTFYFDTPAGGVKTVGDGYCILLRKTVLTTADKCIISVGRSAGKMDGEQICKDLDINTEFHGAGISCPVNRPQFIFSSKPMNLI